MGEAKKVRVKLVVHSDYVEHIRCRDCSALLFKAKIPLLKSEQPMGIEVKCRRCGKINRF
ncbi:MAG: hypothetical protein C4K49_10630 [Candidatus Thorarchaeota archaeon]|nr:MAG: hypothetical protein C4K49_10630 [Candidatus Thorarchaeota archaeon]